MWCLKYIFLLAFCAGIFCESDENFSVDLSPDNFDIVIKESNTFVMFFAPWCGHCKRLHPLWEQLAQNLNNQIEADVIIAKVDCTEHQNLCEKNEVTGYPTLKFFKTGESESIKFKGTRDETTINNFIQEQLGKNTIEEKEGSAEKTPGKILIELTEETFAKHVSSGKHFVKFYAPWCGHCQRLAPVWDELPKSLETDLEVQIAKVDCTVHSSVCQDFLVKSYPTLLWIEDGKKIEKFTGSRNLEDLKAYINKMLGNIEQRTGFTNMPKDATTGNKVVVLTGVNFRSTVKTGITFVKFYAPWCGHCQKLAHVWEQLAENQKSSGVKIAKVDCTSNESKQLCIDEQIEGYPTLFAYKNGKKQKEYTGGRNYDELTTYINKIAQHDEL